MTTFAPICVIEVSMDEEDGTYRVQWVAHVEGGRRVDRTVVGATSIPEGLAQLAREIQHDALASFSRPRP